MKTVKKGEEVKRVKNEDAPGMVKDGWKYCPKSEYKKTRVMPKVESKKVKREKKKTLIDTIKESK
jgi:hypothetical protein